LSTSTWENKTSIPWTSTWEGKEVRDLVAPRKQRPDGVRRGADGEVADVIFYHGDLYHGYPPEHELYDTEVTLPEGRVNNTKEMYEKTMNDMRIFADKALNVLLPLGAPPHDRAPRQAGAVAHVPPTVDTPLVSMCSRVGGMTIGSWGGRNTVLCPLNVKPSHFNVSQRTYHW
jgi:hypothetical protein